MQSPPELVVVVPTLNERANVPELIARLDATLRDIAWEVVFVDDDSPDGTADLVRQLSAHDSRVRCVQRLGRRGLSSACVEGALASAAPVIAVMDADLQHDETLLPAMLAALRADPALDLAVASRYARGGSVGEWESGRVRISGVATHLARLVTSASIADPMSGFFMIRREILGRRCAGCRARASRSCLICWRRRRGRCACGSSPTPSGPGCTATASSIRWSRGNTSC